MHAEAAEKIISDVGYAGVQAGRNIVPRICPFCYHDEDLPDHERITAYGREGHLTHTGDHVKLIKNKKSVRRCPCYPSTCTKADTMDAAQLTTHLAVVHGIDVPNRSLKSRKSTSISRQKSQNESHGLMINVGNASYHPNNEYPKDSYPSIEMLAQPVSKTGIEDRLPKAVYHMDMVRRELIERDVLLAEAKLIKSRRSDFKDVKFKAYNDPKDRRLDKLIDRIVHIIETGDKHKMKMPAPAINPAETSASAAINSVGLPSPISTSGRSSRGSTAYATSTTRFPASLRGHDHNSYFSQSMQRWWACTTVFHKSQKGSTRPSCPSPSSRKRCHRSLQDSKSQPAMTAGALLAP